MNGVEAHASPLASGEQCQIAGVLQEEMPNEGFLRQLWQLALATAKDRSGRGFEAVQKLVAGLKGEGRAVSITELRAMPDVKFDWVIPNLLTRQNTMLLAGEPKKACKSWLLLNLAWDLAEGKAVWNITRTARDHRHREPLFKPERPMRVVYFGQEDALGDIKKRADLICKGGRPPVDNLFVVPKDPALLLDTDTGRKRVIKTIAECAPVDLVIFDPLRNIVTCEENASETSALVFRQCNAIEAQFDCSVIIAHHEKKPPTERGSRHDRHSPYAMRGSSGWYGGADAIVMVVPRGLKNRSPNHHLVELSFDAKRVAAIEPLQLCVQTEAGSVLFEGFKGGRPQEAEADAA